MPRSRPNAEISAFLKRMPSAYKASIEVMCEGDWRRVTFDGTGLTVHNQPQTGVRKAPVKKAPPAATHAAAQPVEPVRHLQLVEAVRVPDEPTCERCGRLGHYTEDCRQPLLRAVKPRFLEPELVVETPAPPPVAEPVQERREEAKKAPAAKGKQPPRKSSSPRQRVELEALAALIGTQAPQVKPGVNIISMSEAERQEREQQRKESLDVIEAVVPYPEGPQDDPLEPTCVQQWNRCKDGLPSHLSATLKPDVELLYGIDKQGIEDTLRHPQRVTIRPESYDKGKRYPVLGFYRGDIEVILGMRFPNSPAVIAAYPNARLMHDTHRVNHMGGGGRKREDTGTPKTPKQVASRLRQLGAQVAEIDDLNPKPVHVLYKGQDLGAITVDKATRATCDSDWNRMQRKIHAIDRRAASVG